MRLTVNNVIRRPEGYTGPIGFERLEPLPRLFRDPEVEMRRLVREAASLPRCW